MKRRHKNTCPCGHHDLPLFQDLDAAGAMQREPEDDVVQSALQTDVTPAAETVSVDPPAVGNVGPELDAREVWDSLLTPRLLTPRPGLAARVRELGALQSSPRSRRSRAQSDRSGRPWGGILDDDLPPAA
jgi:hypothetical protein